jgi:hypothetical protein
MRQSWLKWVVLGGVLLAGGGLEWRVRRVPELNLPLVDAATYHRQAVALAEGRPLARGAFWQAPLYPACMGGIYRVTGVRPGVLRLLQVGLLALTVFLTERIARRWLSPRAALLAALLAALCGPLWFYAFQLMPVLLFTALSLGALEATLRLLERPGPWRALAAGLIWGFAALTVPTVLPAALLLAAILGGRRSTGTLPSPRRWAGLLVLGLTLVIVPVALRNAAAGGAGVLIASNGGINFYLGNNARTDVTLSTRPGLDWERLERLPYLAGARSAGEADRYFYRAAFDWMRRQPVAFVGNGLRKARDFFQGREIPRNLDLETMRPYLPLGIRLLTGRWAGLHWPGGVLIPLGLAGWWLLARRMGTARGVALYGLVLALTIILYFPAGRYRAPLWPLFAIGAAAAVERAVCAWRAGARGAVGGGGAVVLILAVLLNIRWAHPTDRIPFDAELDRAVGAALEMRGELDAAEQRYHRALNRDPDNADTRYHLGNLSRVRGRPDAAMDHYRAALQARPDHDSARGNLGFLLYERGDWGAALSELELAVSLNPLNPYAHHNLGVVLRSVGRRAEAEAHFRKARAIRDLFATL